METQLTDGPLLDEKGNLIEKGYAFSLLRDYDRKAIKVGKDRIKEWDYYYIGNKEFGLALTIADNGYMDLLSVTLLDFKKKTHFDTLFTRPFPMGKIGLPSSSRFGKSLYRKGQNYLSFEVNEKGKRKIMGHLLNFAKSKETLDIDIVLEETLRGNSLVIVTPFFKKKHFYYNQKINLLKPKGQARWGEKIFDFSSSYGVLDWGRGVWTYKNTWYWSSLNGEVEGHPIGWNLGYGFGDTSKASENVFYFDKKVYKLEKVRFEIPISKNGKEDFLKTWKMLGSGLEVSFSPILNRHSDTNLLIFRSNQNQVFGLFSGVYHSPDGDISFKDVPGFAEKVYNKW